MGVNEWVVCNRHKVGATAGAKKNRPSCSFLPWVLLPAQQLCSARVLIKRVYGCADFHPIFSTTRFVRATIPWSRDNGNHNASLPSTWSRAASPVQQSMSPRAQPDWPLITQSSVFHKQCSRSRTGDLGLDVPVTTTPHPVKNRAVHYSFLPLPTIYKM